MLFHILSVSVRQKLIALGKFEISRIWLKDDSKYLVNPHVSFVQKHAGLQRTLKLEFSINMELLKSIYRFVQSVYVTYMIKNDHFMIEEHF